MIDPRDSSLVPALLAGALLTACTGGNDDSAAPKLEQVRFADVQTLRLVFAEAVVVGDADPAAFRLSLGVKDEGSTVYYALDYDGLGYDTDGPVSDSDPSAASASASATSDGTDTGYGTTGDYDPTAGDSGYDPSADDGDYAGAEPPLPDDFVRPIPTLPISDLGITGVRAVDGKPSEVDLVLAGPISDTPACDALADLVADGSKAGIFLHHRTGGSTIENGSGTPLGSIAAHWIDASAKAYVEVTGDFPNLDPYLPIPCP